MEGEHRRLITEAEEFRAKNIAVETVDLPPAQKEELLREGEGSPLHTMLQFLREAGIEDAEIEEYRGVIRAFHERPTHVVRRDSVNFAPQDYYFAPRVDLSLSALLPRIFPSGTEPAFSLFEANYFQPRLDHEGVIREQSLGEEDIRHAFLALTTPNPARQESRADLVATPEERFLVRINRVMYALHEPLHIRQALAVGDRVNMARRQLNAGMLMNEEKERLFVERSEGDMEIRLPSPLVFGKTVFPWPEPGQTKDAAPSKESREWTTAIVQQNEATMDALSELALKQSLREKPAFLLSIHNTLSLAVEMFRDIKARVRHMDKEKNFQEIIDTQKELERVEQLFGFLQQAYFSAFDSSDDAETYFQSDALPKTLGKKLSGAFVKPSHSFDRFLVLNLKLDIQKEIQQKKYAASGKKEHFYPRSSETHLINKDSSDYFGSYPVTAAARALIVDLFDAAMRKGKDGHDVQVLLEKMSKVSYAPEEEIPSALLREIHDEWGLGWQKEDVGELVGMEHAVTPDRDESYPFSMATRKMLMEHFLKTNPTEVAPLVRGLFFQAPFALENRNFARFIGFIRLETKNHDYRPIEDILADQALGVFDLDVSLLSETERDTLHLNYERLRSGSGKEISLGEQQEILRWIVETRRKQVAEHKHQIS